MIGRGTRRRERVGCGIELGGDEQGWCTVWDDYEDDDDHDEGGTSGELHSGGRKDGVWQMIEVSLRDLIPIDCSALYPLEAQEGVYRNLRTHNYFL